MPATFTYVLTVVGVTVILDVSAVVALPLLDRGHFGVVLGFLGDDVLEV